MLVGEESSYLQENLPLHNYLTKSQFVWKDYEDLLCCQFQIGVYLCLVFSS
jgi:hypothetical protein